MKVQFIYIYICEKEDYEDKEMTMKQDFLLSLKNSGKGKYSFYAQIMQAYVL